MLWLGVILGLFIGSNVGIIVACILISEKMRGKERRNRDDQKMTNYNYDKHQQAYIGTYQPADESHLVKENYYC